MQGNSAQDSNNNNLRNDWLNLETSSDANNENTLSAQTDTTKSSANQLLTNKIDNLKDKTLSEQSQTLPSDLLNELPTQSPNSFSSDLQTQNGFQSVIKSPHTPKKYGGIKIVATILGVVLMIGAIGTSVILVQKQQLNIGSAWDCSKYKFNVSRTGVVTVQNGSRYNERPQQAQVYINNTLVSTLSVPELNSGQGATIGTVSVPSQQGFTWKVRGTIDCQNEGNYQAEITPPVTISASCNNVVAYDKNWQQLNMQQLSQLKAGDVVRFSVGGTTTSGNFDKARFTINGVQKPETTNLRPNTSEFYYEYTIPSNTTNFEVKAEIHHSQLGWL